MISQAKLRKCFIVLAVALALLPLSGCVREAAVDRLAQNRDPERAVEINVQLGMRYLQEKDMLNAHRVLNRAYSIDRNHPAVNNALAILYKVEGDDEMVEHHFNKALDTNPEFSAARNNYGVFLFEKGRFDEALAQFQMVIKDYRYPQRFQVFENMGLCYLALDDMENAKQQFQRALQLHADQPTSLYHLAEIAFQQKNYRLSQQYLERLSEYSNSSPQQLWLGIRLQRVLGDRDRLASLELALKNLYPDSPEYQAYLESRNSQ